MGQVDDSVLDELFDPLTVHDTQPRLQQRAALTIR